MDAYVKVLSWHVLYLMVWREVAAYIVRTRESSSRAFKVAKKHLERDAECMLTVSMMAEVSTELLVLLRFLNCDAPDLARIGLECDTFKKKLQFLWDKAGCLRVPGYVNQMRRALKLRFTYTLKGRGKCFDGMDFGGRSPNCCQVPIFLILKTCFRND